TYTAVVQVNNEDLKLRPGMTANASIITAQKQGVLRVPNGALRFRPPEGAEIKTNATTTPHYTSAGDTNMTMARGGPNGSSGELSGEGGARPNRDEMRRRFENMSPEEREQMRERMRTRFGEGGGGAFGRGQRTGGAQEGPVTRTVYLPEKNGKQ